MSDHESATVTLHLRAGLLTLDYDVRVRLHYDTKLNLFTEYSTAANVYDAIGLLREGVVTRGSPFKIEQFGPHSFNRVIDWLEDCGYPINGLRIPVVSR